jgi:DNA polymerase III subunit delta
MVTVLTGTNAFALQQELQKSVQTFLQEHGDMAIERLDGEEVSYERISEAVQSLPFLAARKLVILRAPSARKQFIEQFEALLTDLPEITDIIIIEPKIDKRTAYYKWLKKNTEFKEFNELDIRGLAPWAAQYAKEQGAELSLSDAAYLIDRTGANQAHLSNEIKKLALVGNKITREIISSLTEPTPQSKIFDLLDAAFSGQTKKAMNLYTEQRTMKVEPQEILAMIGWQLRQVALAKTADNKHDLVKEGKTSPYSANKAKAIANRLTLQKLRKLVDDLVALDARSKRQPIDLDEALQTYLLKI